MYLCSLLAYPYTCSDTNFEVDTLFILLPNNTCVTRGLQLNRTHPTSLDLISFFIKYYSYDIPGIEGVQTQS